jgi:hypothetical protein
MATKVAKRGKSRVRRRSALVGRIGGLAAEVAAEDLAALSDDSVRGALLAIAERVRNNPDFVSAWEQAGRDWRDRRARSQTRIMGFFERPVPPAAAGLLRRAGLSQDRELRTVWRGRADPEVAVPLIEGAGGQATVL